jgi:hypothetical protein
MLTTFDLDQYVYGALYGRRERSARRSVSWAADGRQNASWGIVGSTVN